MATERKMISARLPTPLIERVDFVARNTDSSETNRSRVLQAALEGWLPEREQDIGKRLGTTPKKAR